MKELMDLIGDLMTEKRGDHYTNELYDLVTGSACELEQSEERAKAFKGSLIKYMKIQRRRTTTAKESCLRRALITILVWILFCIRVFVKPLILLFCVWLRICMFCYCLLCIVCNLFCSLPLTVLRKLMTIPGKNFGLEGKTPR